MTFTRRVQLKLLLSLLFILPVSQCATLPPPEDGGGELRVTVYHRDRPVPGATLYLAGDLDAFPGRFAYVAETGEDGVGTFPSVKRGAYFLIGTGAAAGGANVEGPLFGYFGGNPLYLQGGDALALVLPLLRSSGPGERKEWDETLIAGRVEHEGRGVEDCFVFAYLGPESHFRDPSGAILGKTDGSGAFELFLPPGAYYLVARKRGSGLMAGPLGEGDFFGYFPGNPVSVGEKERLGVTLPVVRLKMRNDPVYRKRGVATLSGRIVDESGSPVAGAYGALYDNPELLNRPLFVSAATGEDGRFLINVPLPGVYYLGARTGYGGAPGPGDLYGRYEGTVDHSIEVEPGDRIKGIRIVVWEVW